MPQQKIILLYSNGKSNEKKLSKYFSERNIQWTYLGPNYINFKRIDSYLREHFRYIEISKRLDKTSDIIRGQYQHYIDELNATNKDTFEWWFTPISSRNPSMSGVFQNLCYLELIKEILFENSQEEILVIVAENYSIGHAIETNADALGVKVITLGKNKRSLPSRITSGIWWTGKCLFKAGLNYGYARLSAIRSEKKPAQRYSGIAGKTCMINVVVYEKNFADDGGFADRYFPGLEQFLIKNGYNVVYYPTFTETKLNKYNLYCKARANDRVFLIEQDFLKITDYFKSIRDALRSTTFRVNAPLFMGFNVAKIDDGDFKWDSFENIFKAYLQYYAFLRMSLSLGNKFERIISWHENQLQDKALCKAVHETFNVCKIVGGHAYLPLKNIQNTWISIPEYKNGFAPDIILSMCKHEYSNEYYRDIIPVMKTPSFRNISIFNNKKIGTLVQKEKILVLLPISLNDSHELLSKLFSELKESEINEEILVKCHPDYDTSTLLSYLKGTDMCNVKFVFTLLNINELLPQVRLAISAESSSILDFAAAGIPSVFVSKKNSLSKNPLYLDTFSHYKICYGNNELIQQIKQFINGNYDPIKYESQGNLIKENYFIPITEEYLQEYIL